MSDDRLERLETKLSFLEGANADLSDELNRQRQEIAALHMRLVALASRLDSAPGAAESELVRDERPPHY